MKGLIDLAKEGDTAALTQLINEHKMFAFNIALSIVKDSDEAKDITQQSFLIVLEKINSFRNESAFSTWLYKIVYNESVKVCRKRKRVINISLENLVASDIAEEVDEFGEMEQSLVDALDRMGERERLVLTLFYLADKSIDDISNITNLGRSHIKVLLYRGRIRLRKQLRLIV